MAASCCASTASGSGSIRSFIRPRSSSSVLITSQSSEAIGCGSPVRTVTSQPRAASWRERSARCDSTPPVVGGKVQWTSNIRRPQPGSGTVVGSGCKGFAVEPGEGRGHIEEAGRCPPLDFVLLRLSRSEEERLILERRDDAQPAIQCNVELTGRTNPFNGGNHPLYDPTRFFPVVVVDKPSYEYGVVEWPDIAAVVGKWSKER